MLTHEQMQAQYRARYDAEVQAGGRIQINRGLPEVAITMSDGSEYYFQDWQADDLLATVPEWCSAEVFLLASAQNW